MLFQFLISLVCLEPPFRTGTVRMLILCIKAISDLSVDARLLLSGSILTQFKKAARNNIITLKKLVGYANLADILLEDMDEHLRNFE